MRFTVSVCVVWFQVDFGFCFCLLLAASEWFCCAALAGILLDVLLDTVVSWLNRIIAFMR